MKKMKLTFLLATLMVTTSASYAQNCLDSIPATTPTHRFVVLGDGSEVKDLATQLIWQRCSLGQTWDGKTCTGDVKRYGWQNALGAVKALGSQYRLPNAKELQSLIEYRCDKPAINLTVFPNTKNHYYWTSTPESSQVRDSGLKAWFVDFTHGDSAGYWYDSLKKHPNGDEGGKAVRAVRSE